MGSVIEFNIIEDTLYVITTVSGGPSEVAGLLAGDKIIKVDGKNFAGIGPGKLCCSEYTERTKWV